jgi:hypothetical protein
VSTATPTFKYLLRTPTEVLGFAERPTQDSIKARGVGEYTLLRSDGQALKDISVTLNRNSNLKVAGRTPATLDGMTTLNLNRLLKYYERIVKIWPEQSRAVTQVRKQLEQRAELTKQAVPASLPPLRPTEVPGILTDAPA